MERWCLFKPMRITRLMHTPKKSSAVALLPVHAAHLICTVAFPLLAPPTSSCSAYIVMMSQIKKNKKTTCFSLREVFTNIKPKGSGTGLGPGSGSGSGLGSSPFLTLSCNTVFVMQGGASSTATPTLVRRVSVPAVVTAAGAPCGCTR